jgi:hypothetical protein
MTIAIDQPTLDSPDPTGSAGDEESAESTERAPGVERAESAESAVKDDAVGVSAGRWALAALLVGAGAVHVAMAPSHFGESTVEGLGFLAAGWLQLALGGAVLLRPSRFVWGATIAVSAATVFAWVISRTTGLPFGAHSGHAESVTIVDGLTVAMEGAAAVLAAALLLGLPRGVARFRSDRLALASVVAVVALVSMALAAPEARNHSEAAHGGHGHTAADGSGASSAAASGAAGGHDHGAVTDLNGHDVSGVKAQDVAHESEPDQPLDAATREQLAGQLVAAREAAMKYPTVADATRAGYFLVGGGFGPGAGAHYIGGGFGGGGFDPARPPTLIYDGISPTSQVVGLMYLGMGADGAPEGFAGPNDHWHRHSGVCMRGAEVIFPVDADVTEAQCQAEGGNYMATTTWMVHAWVVPGWDSPSGVFSHENPNLRCADGTFDTDDLGRCQGS